MTKYYDDPETEYRLFRQAQTGDKNAFGQLQLLLEPHARRFIRHLIGTHPVEEDIMQDAFLAIYLNLKHIEVPEKLRPFMFRVIRNRSYDILRKQGRYQSISLDTDTPLIEPVTTTPAPDETTQWLLIHAQVKEAMQKLPELQRQTLLLYSEENLSYGEIAEVMNTSVGTVKSRIFHARQTLCRLLDPQILEALGIT